jgi:oxygen-independent coproporphyrinogen III oxidase
MGEIERAVAAAREAGFGNVNLDLMFALPGQSYRGWQHNLERAIALNPEHLSLYCLTIEPNTAFYKQHLHGQLDLPDDDHQVNMYDEALAWTRAAGYEQYEISNFAKPGRECRHNLCYWYGEDYAGYGPGAVGCYSGVRYTNLKHPERYCAAVEAGDKIAFESEALDEQTQRTERIMLGLRLNQGIELEGLGIPAAKLDSLQRRGWIELGSSYPQSKIQNPKSKIRLTAEGRHFCSEVALELI